MLPDLRNVMEEDDVSVVTSIEMTAALVVPAHLLDDDDDKASGGSTSKALQEWVWKHCKDQLLQNLKINRCTANEEKTDTAAAAHVTSPLDESKDDFPKIRRSSSSFTELKLRLLAQIAHVQRQFFQSESPKVVFGWLLESLLELTESEYGFIGELKYDPDGTVFLQTHAITNIAWDQATRKFHDDNVKQGLRFYNMSSLFGSAIRTGKPVISNTPATDSRACGIPKGHPPLHHFLGIPFFKPNGELNGMVGIANRPGGYSEEDIDFLEPFSVTCSNLIQAYVQLEQNRYLINTLEDSVMNRTSELELANTDLELANRQIRKSAAAQLEHFACMSHEIRTPLNCIIGMSNLVKDTEMTPMQEESFRMIISSGDLLLAIVNDVLDFAKLETENVDIDIGLCSFQETLISVIHSIEMKAHSTQTVQPFLDAALPEFVHMDSRRLQQVLFNLLGNAVKFSPDNGVVEFSVALIQCDPTPMSCLSKSTSTASLDLDVKNAIMIDDIEKDGDFSSPPSRCPFHKEPTIVEVASASPIPKACLRFIVKDYGKGIDKTDFDRIFQPFQQAPLGKEEVSGGTGLGLAITHKLVTAMGGSISVDSVKGSWSSFTVDLPFLDDKVNLNDLASTMQTWDVSLVGLPCAKQDNVRRIFSAYDVEATMFGSLENLVVGMPKEGIGRIHVCLVHEDSFDTVICKKLRESPVKTRILSFGPNFSVNATESLHHFRSIESILPSVLMKIMINNISFDVKPETRRTTVSIDTSCLEKVRVLVAEDNVVNQKVLFKMLERMGVKHIDMANNGLIACEKEEVQNPPYDIILMDQQMPIMGGVDACRRIVNRIGTHTRPKVVFVTAHVSPQFEEECIDAGGSGFLPKPFKLEQITSCFQTFFATTNKS